MNIAPAPMAVPPGGGGTKPAPSSNPEMRAAARQVLTHVAIPAVVYTNALEDARRLIVDAASAVQAGRPADPAAFASANARLKSIMGQFDFDIHKHDPIPPAS